MAEHGFERGWHRYGFDNLDFRQAAIHGSRIPIGVQEAFDRGPGQAHVSFGVIPPSEDDSIGMHIHRDVPSATDVEEWYIIIDGTGEMTFSNGDRVAVGPGDLVAVYPGTGHAFRATGEAPVRLVSITPVMYTSHRPGEPLPAEFRPQIEVEEADPRSMNPLRARCTACDAAWERPADDPGAASLPEWARDHRCSPDR